MPFVSSGPLSQVIATATNKLANGIAQLQRRPVKTQLEPWDPFRCTGFEQENISKAFFSLGNSQIPEIEKHGDDWKKLADLMKTKTVDSVNISCGTCFGAFSTRMSSNAANQSLQVCLDTSNRDLLANWLVVEVVHLCGGTDLDAWAVKNWLFNVNKGSYPYSYFPVLASELALMCQGGTPIPGTGTPPYLAGKFTVWNPVNGSLWPSTHDPATGKVGWTPGSGLIPFNITYWQYVC